MNDETPHQTDEGGYTYPYPRPAVTVDVVVFTCPTETLQLLLIRRKYAPFAGAWALPGGFVEMDEDLETAALRELAEETNIHDLRVQQLSTFGAPHRDPRTRVISVAYLGLLGRDDLERSAMRSASDASEAAWWDARRLPEMAFDHAQIVACALERLRVETLRNALAFGLLPVEFTLAHAQSVYEAALGQPAPTRSFRRRLLASGIVAESGQTRAVGRRPAKLYRLTSAAGEIELAQMRFP